MKEINIFSEFSDTGPNILDVDKTCEQDWLPKARKGTLRICRDAFITKYHDEFSIVFVRNSVFAVKSRIDKASAHAVIRRMDLVKRDSPVFNFASTYRNDWSLIDKLLDKGAQS